MRNHTGTRPWTLTGPQGENPAWAPNQQVRFLLNDVPELTTGTLCNHLLGILVTFQLIVGDSGVQTPSLNADALLTRLLESVEVRNCWHGTPVSQNHCKGCMLGLMEFLACGYQYFGRRICVPHGDPLDPVLAGRVLEVNTFIPLSYLMGEKGHHTALPVTFYRNAELQLNFGLGPVDGAGEAHPTWSTGNVRASAIMLAESEIHVGPGQQFIDYTSPASVNSENVKLDSLGSNTTLHDVEGGAGIDFLAWLSAHYDQGQGFAGAAFVRNLRRVAVPFRGTQQSRHLQSFLLPYEAAIGGREVGESDPYDATAMEVRVSNLSGFPYAHNYAGTLAGDFPIDNEIVRDMMHFPIIFPGRDLEVTKIQSFEGTQTYMLAFLQGGGPVNGALHHTYAHQFFSWTPAKWDDALRVLVNSSVAQSVLGRSTGLVWSTKFSKKNADIGRIDPSKLRYIAQKLTLGTAE